MLNSIGVVCLHGVCQVGSIGDLIDAWGRVGHTYTFVAPSLLCEPGAANHGKCRGYLRALLPAAASAPTGIVWVWVCMFCVSTPAFFCDNHAFPSAVRARGGERSVCMLHVHLTPPPHTFSPGGLGLIVDA
jgi:hypothetical protein